MKLFKTGIIKVSPTVEMIHCVYWLYKLLKVQILNSN
ncbi:uncharacterized protein METZ01_LOCUS26598 [marine metagenome]|uniref:Uncharacterized protein n=1 Tax=marine metagenome TaxID=408172 RepID=A0A381Q4B7_9ZZZZ